MSVLTVMVSTVFVLLDTVDELTISPSSDKGSPMSPSEENSGGGGTGKATFLLSVTTRGTEVVLCWAGGKAGGSYVMDSVFTMADWKKEFMVSKWKELCHFIKCYIAKYKMSSLKYGKLVYIYKRESIKRRLLKLFPQKTSTYPWERKEPFANHQQSFYRTAGSQDN